MDGLPYLAALVLAATFGWAGVTKLGGRRRTARTFRALGLPAAEGLAATVPLVELALAAGLAVAPGWAAAGALALLAAFSVFLFRAVRDGVDVGCGCFGSAATEPVSTVDLLRNGMLAVAGAIALAAPRPEAPSAAAVVVAVGAVALAVLALTVARRERRAVEEGPPLDSAAPRVAGLDYGSAGATLVAFASPSCPRCDGMRRSLAALDGDVQVQVVDLDAASRATFDAFGVRGTPFVVAVDPAGTVRGRGAATSVDELDRLVAAAAPRPG